MLCQTATDDSTVSPRNCTYTTISRPTVYTCACFCELEWPASRTQARQRKRPFSYLKRRHRNNYHRNLSMSSPFLFATSTIFYRVTSALLSVHFSLSLSLSLSTPSSFLRLFNHLSFHVPFLLVLLLFVTFSLSLSLSLSFISFCPSPSQSRRATQVAPVPKVVAAGVGGVKRLGRGDWCKINFVSSSA